MGIAEIWIPGFICALVELTLGSDCRNDVMVLGVDNKKLVTGASTYRRKT